VTMTVVGPRPGARHWLGITAMLAVRTFRLRYLRSRLGVGWAFVQPALQAAVLSLVFLKVFKVNKVEHYPLYVLSGIMTWQAFAGSLNAATTAALDNAALLRKVAMPAVVFPLSQVASVALVYVMQSSLLVLVAAGSGTAGVKLVLLPAVVLLVGLVGFSAGLLTCALQVQFRDVKFIVEAGLLALFYASPVLYAPEHLSPSLARWLELNPMFGVVTLARTALLDRPFHGRALISTGVAVAVLLAVGTLVFRRRSRDFADLV
jgi:ABC-type polysaccharide/polyol phosphate export permease